MSLVPEYDSDSSESDKSSNSNVEKLSETKKTNLPSAMTLLSGDNSKGEVFNNKFRAVEIAKLSSLEKHVKMVNTDEQITIKNGKKICWNYRKGRCRFGSKCTFAHDSDVQLSDTIILTTTQEQQNPTNQINQQEDIHIPTKTNYNLEDNKKRKYTNTVIPRMEKAQKKFKL